jgi:HemX protein
MHTIELILRILVPLVFFPLAVQYLTVLIRGGKLSKQAHLFNYILVIAVLTLFLVVRSLNYERCPFGNLFEALSFIVWLLMLFYFFLERHTGEPWLGLLVVPLNAVIMVVSVLFINSAKALPVTFKSTYFPFHVSLSLAAYVFLCLSFISSLVYIKQFKDIKGKKQGLLYRKLPSLENVEHYIYTAAVIGWVLLAAGTLIGVIWAKSVRVPLDKLIFKMASTFIVLGIYGVLLVVRQIKKAGGRRIAFLSVLGFLWIIVTLSIGKHAF